MIYLKDFTKICSKPVKLHKPIPDDKIRLIYGEFKRLHIISQEDFDNFQGAYNMPKTVYIDHLLRFTYYNMECMVYPYLTYLSQEEMLTDFNERMLKRNYFITDEYKHTSIIIKLEKPSDSTYCMSYYINNSIIDNIYKGKKETKLYIFTELITTQLKSNIIEDNILALKTLALPPSNKKSSKKFIINKNILKTDINLYEYQKRDLIWMQDIEQKIQKQQNVIKYKYNLIYPLLNNKFVLLNHNIFPSWLLQETPEFMKSIINITYYGGNLISKIGLGKTIISLYNIFESAYTNRAKYEKFVSFSDKCNYMYKRGKKKGESCCKNVCLNELYCTEHKTSIFIDKRVLIYQNTNEFKVENFLENNLIKTNASLVICPNQLCDQWINEYYDKFINDKRVILIVTRDQYNNITLGDILFADIIVVSYQFLLNIHNNSPNNNVQSKFVIENEVIDLFNSKELTNFHFFKWEKIFLDEAHEIKNMAKGGILKNIISKFKSNFKWNVTGTPFANGMNGFLHLLSYNTNYDESHKNVDFLDTYEIVSSGIRKELVLSCKHLFRCNSKESIVEEYKGNIIKEHIKKLDFTVQERNIYNSYLEGTKNKYADFLIKLCCHSELNADTKTLIQNCKTLDEIQKTVLEINKIKLRDNQKELNNVIAELEKEEHLLETMLERRQENNVEQIKANIANLKRKKTSLTATCSSLERTFNYLNSEIKKLQESTMDLTCPICLDDIEQSTLTITKCGHKFCWDCLFETFNIKSSVSDFKCPTCNGLLNQNEVYRVDEKENVQDETELTSIIQKVKSTKIGNIVHFIKTSLSACDKVIIFSQWDEMLHKVGNILQDYNINLVYCNGSVYQRKRAIQLFSTDPNINIIMLSSRNAASGINLTQANKIILFEPVYGSSDYRKEIESQAIGRSDRIGQKRPIDVYRFIIKDTIEQDIVEGNIDDNKMKLMII
jgi:SNF2 family DNA or RNA helicase